MFKSLEVGKKLKRSEFDELETPLRHELLQAQFSLAEQDYPLIIVVAGLDGAGKSGLAHRLNEWMDPRGIETLTFWEHSDEEESRPFFWRFWRKLPPNGETGLFLGSWYTRPGVDFYKDKITAQEFSAACQDIEAFESMLSRAGAVIVKLWLHVTREAREKALKEAAPSKKTRRKVPGHDYDLSGSYSRGLEVSEQIILQTDSDHSPWHLIEAEDRHYRDITAGQIILEALQHRANRPTGQEAANVPASAIGRTAQAGEQPTILDTVDLEQALDRDTYKEKLSKYQSQLNELAWQVYSEQRSVVAVFEGWDAAGKGSAIRRVTQGIDPRLFRLLQFAAPSDEERAHHYLWRFWRQLERDGRATLFDRSWYGRVLVERVEGFASEEEWQRSYSEINQFEKQLTGHGTIVLKFWLHISADEQLARFKAREQEPHKQHKITEEDWRNRDKWRDYELAVDEMVARTNTSHAPWTLVAGNDKYYARIQILKTFCKAMEKAID